MYRFYMRCYHLSSLRPTYMFDTSIIILLVSYVAYRS